MGKVARMNQRGPPAAISNPLVTVCIPVRNRVKLLQQAIFSIHQQTYQTIQLVVVDDGSDHQDMVEFLRDKLPELLKGFGHGSLLVRNPRQMGDGASRNVAARFARGDYLIFIDSDNYATPQLVC